MHAATGVLFLFPFLFVMWPLDASAPPAFQDLAASSGLAFRHVNGAAGKYHLPEIMGAGGALLDYDRDGDLDVFLIQGHELGKTIAPGAGQPRLFRSEHSRTRELRYVDVSHAAGFGDGDYGMGVAVGDYDNDGDPDLYLTNFGPNRLYRNDGGRFTDVTRTSGKGLDDPRWSTAASFTDYDADGDLDLFVTNYVDFSLADNKACTDPTGLRDYCGPLQFRAAPDRLFRNNGDGRFDDVTDRAGVGIGEGAGLGVAGADFTGDGRQDFYVANDGSANHLWVNRGDGTFTDGALLAGVAVNAEGQPEGSMGIAVADPDDDGDLDLFVTNITGESHAYYENGGGGRFEDRRQAAGLGRATRPYTGFGTGWFDYDGDGALDLFIANGAVTIIEALRGDPFPFRQKNLLLRRIRDRYQDVSAAAGETFGTAQVGRGAAFGDVDADGDIDVLVTNNGGPPRLLINEAPPPQQGFLVRLAGVRENSHGLGARVGLMADGRRTVWRRAHTDGSYLSGSDPRVHFPRPGGTVAGSVSLVVKWPGGSSEVWHGMRPDAAKTITLKEGTGKPGSW